MERRTFLRTSGVVGTAALSGCSGLLDSSAESSSEQSTRPPRQRAQTDPEIVEVVVQYIDENTAEWADDVAVDDISTAFLETVQADGMYTENGSAFLDRLGTIESSLGLAHASLAAVSVAEFSDISDDDVATVDRWLNSPEWFQRRVFRAGSTAGSDQIVGGLSDTSGDGLRDGFLLAVLPEGIDWWDEPAPEFAERVFDLQGDGYTQRSLDYLAQLSRYWQERGRAYGRWAQAKRQGLLADATADGEVSEDDVWGLGSDSDDGLINAQARAFGVDPEQEDTSGDGFLDHLTWLMSESFDLPVVPDEPNVYVEVAAVEGVERLTDREKQFVKDLFLDAPGGPVHVHFYEGQNGVEPLENETAVTKRAHERAERRDLGYHFVLLNDEPLDFDGIRNRRGLNRGTDSWVDASTASGRARASALAHELAHSFGIADTDFVGVDSEIYTMGQYESVLNYNRNIEFLGFNDGKPFDDWAHMRESQYGNDDVDVSAIEAAWEAGMD